MLCYVNFIYVFENFYEIVKYYNGFGIIGFIVIVSLEVEFYIKDSLELFRVDKGDINFWVFKLCFIISSL